MLEKTNIKAILIDGKWMGINLKNNKTISRKFSKRVLRSVLA